MTFRLVGGDAIEAMQAMAENSVDAIVTDPPYGLEFMGKEWDAIGGRGGNGFDAAAGGGFRQGGGEMGKALAALPTSASRKSVPKCAKCGKWQYNGWKPRECTCAEPEWVRSTSLAYPRRMQEWHHAWATEALRILKPGGHLLAFGGTRTYHRLACAIEDAGFEIRDCIAWMYGSGFPKSLDVSKAIDKAAGAEREGAPANHVREVSTPVGIVPNGRCPDCGKVAGSQLGNCRCDRTTLPATPEAQRWAGYGTSLKPAFEPVVMARKPLSERNVAANVQRWGTGALNVDGCRIGTEERTNGGMTSLGVMHDDGWKPGEVSTTVAGRWPANVTLDETAAAMLDEQTGELPGGNSANRLTKPWGFGDRSTTGHEMFGYGDTGGASRFFYCPKADREERNRGLGHMAQVDRSAVIGQLHEGTSEAGNTTGRYLPRANSHPTVKPVELMRWLCRMVTPKGGTVLDPFTGSGSTGVAAMREGFEFVGIEREAEYVEIARARIIGDAPLFNVEVG